MSSVHSDSDDSDLVLVGMDDGVDTVSLGGASDAFGSADPLDELAASRPAPVEEGAEAVDDGADGAGVGEVVDEDDDSVSASFSTSSMRNKERVSVVALQVVVVVAAFALLVGVGVVVVVAAVSVL